MHNNTKITIIDKEFEAIKISTKLLTNCGIMLDNISYLSDDRYLSRIEEIKPDLIILDLKTNDHNSYATFVKIRRNKKIAHIPIVILSEQSNIKMLNKCLAEGAVDFISKPIRKIELEARLTSVIRLDELGKELKNKVKLLENLNNTIDEELKVARDVQLCIVGTPEFTNKDVSIYSKIELANKLGGDYYDIKVVDNRKILGTIADVSGHGVASSLLVMMLKTLIDTQGTGFWTPAELMDIFQDSLYGIIPKGYFVVMHHFTYEPSTKKFTFSNCGFHDIVILRKNNNKKRELEFETTRNFAIAFIPNTEFIEKEFFLEQGDKVVIYTDGFIEAANSKDEMYSNERFFESLKKNYDLPAQQLLSEIFQDRDAFIKEVVPSDDTTVMIVEIQ